MLLRTWRQMTPSCEPNARIKQKQNDIEGARTFVIVMTAI